MSYERWSEARKVCVIGAGTMGSGIAAHLANLGFEVTLLDLTQDSVRTAFDRAKSAKPPHFFVPKTAERIRLGSIQENLDWAAESDWICEAIIEKLDAKRELFQQLDAIVPESTPITTNTSGLEIQLLAEGRSEAFRRKFLGTHFFNPPRYLKLLELIPTNETDPEAVVSMTRFLEDRVARRVVLAKDTPGFIANRFGMWAMFHAIHSAEKLGLSVEQTDLITGPFLGRPRTGSFRLNDLVGLDIMLDIAQNLVGRCASDPHMINFQLPASMDFLLQRGWIGEKAGQGYYRREGKELVALDLSTHAYRDRQEAHFQTISDNAKKPLAERLQAALQTKDEVGEFLRTHLIPVLQYAIYLKEEISHSVLDFDRVMEWGFGWEKGPFAMIDMIGGQHFNQTQPFYTGNQQLSFSGTYQPKPEEPQYRQLSDFPIRESLNGFNVRDLDGMPCVSITTKMGTINPSLVENLTAYVSEINTSFILASEAKHFSLGYDLNFFLEKIDAADWTGIDHALNQLQQLAVLFSTKPCVAAVHGYVLGAGLELAFQCPVVAAHCDAQIGFPESKVGLLPGGGGTAEMALRSTWGGAKSLVENCVRLVQGEVSTNADHAKQLGYLRPTDVILYHPERLYTDAIMLARQVSSVERSPWQPVTGPITGMIDQASADLRNKGLLTEFDETIGENIRAVFTKPHSFEEALVKEREQFLELCHKALTHARIKHMLDTGKPLRN